MVRNCHLSATRSKVSARGVVGYCEGCFGQDLEGRGGILGAGVRCSTILQHLSVLTEDIFCDNAVQQLNILVFGI